MLRLYLEMEILQSQIQVNIQILLGLPLTRYERRDSANVNFSMLLTYLRAGVRRRHPQPTQYGGDVEGQG